jgi:hypothetical protein
MLVQMGDQPLKVGPFTANRQTEHACDGLGQQFQIHDRCQVDEVDPIGKPRQQVVRNLEREACLAAATRAAQCNQPSRRQPSYCGVMVRLRPRRSLSDEQLDLAAPNSLHADAPVTTQFWIENHPLARAYRHLASIRAAVSIRSK